MSDAKLSKARWVWGQFTMTWPLFLAASLTVGFGMWIYFLASEIVQSDSGQQITRWHQFRSGEPNTMGDTLAGFIGSLTLIWVVASVIQQSMELRAQRKEFAEMVIAQEAQVAALKAQADILLDEKRRRDEAEYSNELGARLESVWAAIRKDEIALATWFFERTFENEKPRKSSIALVHDVREFRSMGAYNGIPFFSKVVGEAKVNLRKMISQSPLTLSSSPAIIDQLWTIYARAESIEEIIPLLPKHSQITVEEVELEALRREVRSFLEFSEIWQKSNEVVAS